MPNLARLPIKAEGGYLRVVIETPRGLQVRGIFDLPELISWCAGYRVAPDSSRLAKAKSTN